MFWIKIQYFSNVLDPGQSYCFQRFRVQNYETFQICRVETQLFSNVLNQKKILFKYFGENFNKFRIIFGQNQILSQCFR